MKTDIVELWAAKENDLKRAKLEQTQVFQVAPLWVSSSIVPKHKHYFLEIIKAEPRDSIA